MALSICDKEIKKCDLKQTSVTIVCNERWLSAFILNDDQFFADISTIIPEFHCLRPVHIPSQNMR